MIACGLISSKREEVVGAGEVKESFPESTLLACEFLFPSGRVLNEHRLHGEGSDGTCLPQWEPEGCVSHAGQMQSVLRTENRRAGGGGGRAGALVFGESDKGPRPLLAPLSLQGLGLLG